MKIEKLIETIKKKLRHPLHGCDWDKKQTHKTLMKYVIEEAYEVVDAIDEDSDKNLKEELGRSFVTDSTSFRNSLRK